jgi:hypothetical protein
MSSNYQSPAVTLSVSRVGSRQLMVGKLNEKIKYICNGTNYRSVTTLLLPSPHNDGLGDAVWTADEHIVYTTVVDMSKINRAMTMSQNGDVIALTKLTGTARLIVSANNVVYLTDAMKGGYQSSNEGRT